MNKITKLMAAAAFMLAAGVAQAQIDPLEQGVTVPTQFGETRQGQTYSFTEVLSDGARLAIASPVFIYIINSANKGPIRGCFYTPLSRWYDEHDITLDQAMAENNVYNDKWTYIYNRIDYIHVKVEKVNWNGPLTYMVSVPFGWSVTSKTGKKFGGVDTVLAYVQPGVHYHSGHPGYFIGSIWNQPK